MSIVNIVNIQQDTFHQRAEPFCALTTDQVFAAHVPGLSPKGRGDDGGLLGLRACDRYMQLKGEVPSLLDARLWRPRVPAVDSSSAYLA